MPNYQETISQVLSPTNATYINGVSVRRDFSKAVLECIFQGMVEKDGRGVNGNFVTEKEANDAGQVFVNRVKAHLQKGRQHGAAKNGGAFANTGWMSSTETVGIDVLELFDETITIPRVTQDRIDVDLAAKEIANYVNSIVLAVNGSSYGAKWFATYNANADKRNVKKITSTDITNKNVLLRFIEANSMLDEGDEEHDIDIFDPDTRIGTFQVSYRATLVGAGVLVLGGANYGYDIARKGTVDAGSESRKLDDGFWGYIDNVPCHGISNLSLKYAAWFCGMPEKEFNASGCPLKGWISSSLANARGFSTLEQVKIVDAIAGQGIVIQPLSKLGAVSWYPKGNVAICDDDYDPIAGLKALFTGTDITFKLKSAGSRYYSDDATVSAISASAFTASATAKDDAGTSHVAGAYFYVGDEAVTTVGAFLKGAAGATYKGTFTLGASKSTTIASTKYVNVLVIADDGSCTIVSKQYTA